MLVELAIGDAYGAGFEFSSRGKIAKFNNASAYAPGRQNIPSGHYTDDTQMSLAIAELIIQGTPWTNDNIADKFVECFRRDIRPGYAHGFYNLLHTVGSGEEFLQKITPISTRNGAAMRAAPIGIIARESLVLEMSAVQACITHNTMMGVKSAQAIALAAHYFFHDKGTKHNLREYVADLTHYPWRNNWQGAVRCCGKETVDAVLTVLDRCTTLRDVLIQSVNMGGDVDTVAALAVSIASLSRDYEDNIPKPLYKSLEQGRYGLEYLRNIDDKLRQKLALSA